MTRRSVCWDCRRDDGTHATGCPGNGDAEPVHVRCRKCCTDPCACAELAAREGEEGR